MAPNKFCPTCKIAKKSSKLVLRQINFGLAVYLCEDDTCSYPEGYEFVHVQQRSFDKLLKQNKEDVIEKSDLDKWLEEFFDDEDKKEQSNETSGDDELSKIIDEITNGTNENDNITNDQDLFSWIDDALEEFCVDKTVGNKTSKIETVNNIENVKIEKQNSITSEINGNNSEEKSKAISMLNDTTPKLKVVRRINKKCTTSFLRPGWVFSPKRKQFVKGVAAASKDTTSTVNKFADFKYVNIHIKPEPE